MSTPEFSEIRKATHDDLDEIGRLWMAMMDEHMRFEPRVRLTPSARQRYTAYAAGHLHGPESLCAVIDDPASDEPRLAAYCLGYISENLPMFEPAFFGFISDMAVDKIYRRHGLGDRLINHVKDWMRQKQVEVIQLQVYANNENGQAFWKQQGFESFFERKWLDL